MKVSKSLKAAPGAGFSDSCGSKRMPLSGLAASVGSRRRLGAPARRYILF
jgi:hypothetical protein